MKIKVWILALLCVLCGTQVMAQVSAKVTRVVGADLSLVPAYESAGDTWKDASGNKISDMITYMKGQGLTSVRVRLLVDPSQDSYVATCQDLTYVEKLGKRIKDAGMLFLLDIFYSDTFTDVSKQWIPKGWSMSKSTETSTLAAKVKSYTTEAINALVAYGAKPDYVQIGNEVSYGMLWDSKSGASTSNAFYTSGTYSKYSTQITRFASLLTAAAEGVRASNAPKAKIILHTERSAYSAQEVKFYTWMSQAGFTDYDIIGLSYYPFWHGNLSTLEGTLSALTTSFPNKEIQIVETAYYNSSSAGSSTDTDMSGTWAYSFAGQAAFISDLTSTLNNYTNVTGLYYWQPEECGNGANSSGTAQVMDAWDNRGLWDITWKSTSHTMKGSATLTNLVKFNHTDLSDITDEEEESETVTTDISDKFTNLDFEDCVYDSGNGYFTSVPGWTINYDAGFSSSPWAFTVDQWNSSLCDGYGLKTWNAASNKVSAGNVISQSLASLPAGTYTLSAVVYTDYSGFQLFANDDATDVTVSSDWGTAYNITVTTTLSEKGSLTIGLKLPSAISTTSAVNLYCDNFKVTQTVSKDAETEDTDSIYWHEGIKYIYRTDGTAYVAGYAADTLATNTAGGVELLGSFTVAGTTYYPSWIAEWSMENYPLGWITIPSSITSIGKGAFYKSALTHVTIYGDYVKIWDYAFTGYDSSLTDKDLGSKGTALTDFTIYATDPTSNVTISDKAFCADDIDAATLYVYRSQEKNSIYTALGFKNICHIGCVRGDADESGTVDQDDVDDLVNILLGKTTPTCNCNADTDANGSVSLSDLTELINSLTK